MSGREPSGEYDWHRVRSRPYDCGPARYVERELAASRKFDGRILSHSLWKIRLTCSNLFVLLCRSVSVSSVFSLF